MLFRSGVYLLMNTWGFQTNNEGIEPQYNSAVLISPNGEKVYEYDKNALVPFGEYIPARNWLPAMRNIKALVGDITPGTSISPAEMGGARLGTLICFETTRPELGIALRKGGASALMQLSNEAWFGPTSAPRQMLTSAIFRAVENNIDLIRSANSGVSARIDRYGMVQGETPMFETAVRTWRIKTVDEASADRMTFYSLNGDVFAVSCAVLSLVQLLGSVLVSLRNREDGG